jgi:hypothetical protein
MRRVEQKHVRDRAWTDIARPHVALGRLARWSPPFFADEQAIAEEDEPETRPRVRHSGLQAGYKVRH